MPNYVLHAALKGILEGLTEFLPISSTAHLILARNWLPLAADADYNKKLEECFDIVVQFPAILAVVIFFRARLFASIKDLAGDPKARRFWARRRWNKASMGFMVISSAPRGAGRSWRPG